MLIDREILISTIHYNHETGVLHGRKTGERLRPGMLPEQRQEEGKPNTYRYAFLEIEFWPTD